MVIVTLLRSSNSKATYFCLVTEDWITFRNAQGTSMKRGQKEFKSPRMDGEECWLLDMTRALHTGTQIAVGTCSSPAQVQVSQNSGIDGVDDLEAPPLTVKLLAVDN